MSDPCPTCGHNPDTEVFTGPVTINAAASDAAFRRALTQMPADKTPLQMHAEADGSKYRRACSVLAQNVSTETSSHLRLIPGGRKARRP